MAVPFVPGSGSNQPEDEHTERPTGPSPPKPTRPASSQGYSTLRFIDEGERRNNEANVKRDVRSHVRRGSHARQRRLNAAARPRPLGFRTLLEKNDEVEERDPKSQEYQAIAAVPDRLVSSMPCSSGHVSPTSAAPDPLITQDVIGKHAAASLSRLPPPESRMFSVFSAVSQAERPFFSPPLPRLQFNTTTPYALLLGDGAPTLQLQGRNWPFLQPIRGNGPALSVWMPAGNIPVPNARAPRPCLLKSAPTISWVIESSDYFSFKDEVIRWVNRNLSDPNDATSEVTIGVILCLMSWEVPRGNAQELALHMNGLLRIVNLRGGLQNLASASNFCWKLQFIDLLVAIQTNRQPLFPPIQLPAPGPPPHLNQSIGNYQIPDSPLFSTIPFQDILATCPFDQQSRQILQHMRDLTQGHAQHTFPIPAPSPFSTSLSTIIYHTSTIYASAFSDPPTPFHSAFNNHAVREICAGLEDTRNDETWTRYPGIMLWIALTANAAAANLPQRGFFAMFILRVGTSAAWWGVEAAGSAMRRFVEVKRRAEGLGDA